ncbi:N-acetyltransferase B complex non catalytic subunit-domain-containing protein [Xylariaceae sp. FL1019]|nr:N-acetyltransferase B complex non catalytic subunit-domain-containing protein [Xylariaceae sp. FL1019]
MTGVRIAAKTPRPSLREYVDVQLEKAWYDQNWALVASLARNRLKTSKDDYFKALELYAQSYSDNHSETTLVREAIQKLAKDKAVIKDSDALNLYESAYSNAFSYGDLTGDYADTIGALRLAHAKANHKDLVSCTYSLEACLFHGDFANAQEIAALLKSKYPSERRYALLNVLTLYLFATKGHTKLGDVQSEAEFKKKKEFFATLSLAQADRTLNVRQLSTKGDHPEPFLQLYRLPEVVLWLQVREAFGTPKDNLDILKTPRWGAITFLEQGFTDAYHGCILILTKNCQWGEILAVGYIILDRIRSPGYKRFLEQSKGAEKIAGYDDEQFRVDLRYTEAAQDQFLWNAMYLAATSRRGNFVSPVKRLRNILAIVAGILESHGLCKPIFRTNYHFLVLRTILADAERSQANAMDPRNGKIQLLLNLAFGAKDSRHPLDFMLLKAIFKHLTNEEIAFFVSELENHSELLNRNSCELALVISTKLKTVFFLATSSTAGQECPRCRSIVPQSNECEECLVFVTTLALQTYREWTMSLGNDASMKVINNPLEDICLIGAIGLIKLAITPVVSWAEEEEAPSSRVKTPLLLAAVAFLDSCLYRVPRGASMRVLLVRLYFMMGCVTRGTETWDCFHVKNMLLESLGSVCLDRLSTISPGHLIYGSGHNGDAAQATVRYYERATQSQQPETLITCVRRGNYKEAIQAVERAQRMSQSCTLVTSVIEQRRAMRLKGRKNDIAIDDEPLMSSISSDVHFEDITDYNTVPHWEGKTGIALQELLTTGPLPSNHRCHLSILAERFIDVITRVQPKEQKPSKPLTAVRSDCQAMAIRCRSLIWDEIGAYMDGNDAKGKVSFPEKSYFLAIAGLANIVRICLEQMMDDSEVDQTDTHFQVLTGVVVEQMRAFLTIGQGGTKRQVLHAFMELHAMGMLRETSHAIRATVQYLTNYFAYLKAADGKRPAINNSINRFTSELKKMSAMADSMNEKMKLHIKALNTALSETGWVDFLVDEAFSGGSGDDAEGAADNRAGCEAGDGSEGGTNGDSNSQQSAGVMYDKIHEHLEDLVSMQLREQQAMGIVDSWRDTLRGWNQVKFD